MRVGRRAVLRGAVVGGAVGAGTVAAMPAALAARGPRTGPHNVNAAAVTALPGGPPRTLRVDWHVATERRAIALSFDDGPDPRWTPEVLDLLGEHGARASFFVCGENARRHPDLVRGAAARGEVGNHSFSHPDLATLAPHRVAAEVDRAHVTLSEILDAPPRLFRPPYGNVSGPVLAAAARHGYGVVLWTDHLRDRDTSVAADVARIVGAAAPGRIVLGHDGRRDRSGDLARLPGVLRGLRAEGYDLVTFTELLESAAPDG